MSVTSKDVAMRAQVSPMTVSRVFSPRTGFPIAAATRERVHAAARELGYRPNRLARALATGRTHVITLYIPELTSYHAQVVRSMQALLMAAHYEMIMLIDEFRLAQPEGASAEGRLFPSDGIIAVDVPGWLGQYVQGNRAETRSARSPLVSIGTVAVDPADCVLVDLRQGAQQAVGHLIACGARRIGYLVPRFASMPGDPRWDGYTQAMGKAGLEPQAYQITWPTREVAHREVAALLAEGDPPEALFCFNDDCAIGAFAALRERGLRVPDDLLLCGCDGLPDLEFLAVPLTTIVQPMQEMCRIAWEFLTRRIEDPTLPRQQAILQPKLVTRRSTDRTA